MLNPETVEPGDVVVLNSGGPAMTVLSVEDDMVNCIWFTSKGKVDYTDFPCETLTYSYPKEEAEEKEGEE